jgi:protein-disulfide isomerase
MPIQMMLRTVIAVTAFLALTGGARAQNPSGLDDRVNQMQIEMQRMRTDLETMKGNIDKIVQYLQQAQIPAPLAAAGNQAAKLSIAGAPVLGRKDAPVTIVEFSDFECQFCQSFFASTLPQIKRDYIDTGKVRYVLLDFPLDRLHRNARKAAEAAHCAADQGKYWEMHDILFAQRGKLDVAQYGGYAKKLGLNSLNFDACLKSGRKSTTIDRGMAGGAAIGIRVTPSFIVSVTEPGDVVSGGAVITGAQSFEEYRTAIEQALASK